MKDKHSRTVVKTVTWRAIATITTVGTIYLWTGNIAEALGAGLLANLFKTFFYYAHERLWNRTDWGKETKTLK